jgi:hypothetical protein
VSIRNRLSIAEEFEGIVTKPHPREEDDGSCYLCGHNPDAKVQWSIVWEGSPDAPEESSEPCPNCGARRTIVLDWDEVSPLYREDTLETYPYDAPADLSANGHRGGGGGS